MPHARRHGMPDLPDAEIEKYLPPGVPLKWPADPLTEADESFAAIHRTMIVGHARICAALEVLAGAHRQVAEAWNQGMADMRIAISNEPLATKSDIARLSAKIDDAVDERLDPLELSGREEQVR